MSGTDLGPTAASLSNLSHLFWLGQWVQIKEPRQITVVILAVDFSKSFSRCAHVQLLQSYAKVGASQWLLNMHAAFLMGRTMSVKAGSQISNPKPVTGGAVQGSVLGVLDHNVVLDDLDNEVDDNIYVAKYVDDLTMIETVNGDIKTEISLEPSKPHHKFEPTAGIW